jgi:hypothetical protein
MYIYYCNIWYNFFQSVILILWLLFFHKSSIHSWIFKYAVINSKEIEYLWKKIAFWRKFSTNNKKSQYSEMMIIKIYFDSFFLK